MILMASPGNSTRPSNGKASRLLPNGSLVVNFGIKWLIRNLVDKKLKQRNRGSEDLPKQAICSFPRISSVFRISEVAYEPIFLTNGTKGYFLGRLGRRILAGVTHACLVYHRLAKMKAPARQQVLSFCPLTASTRCLACGCD